MPVVCFRKGLIVLLTTQIKIYALNYDFFLSGRVSQSSLQGRAGYRDTSVSLCASRGSHSCSLKHGKILLDSNFSFLTNPNSWPLCQNLWHWKKMSSRKCCVHWWSQPSGARWIKKSSPWLWQGWEQPCWEGPGIGQGVLVLNKKRVGLDYWRKKLLQSLMKSLHNNFIFPESSKESGEKKTKTIKQVGEKSTNFK